MPSLLGQLTAAGLDVSLDTLGQLHVVGRITDDHRLLIRCHRNELVGQVRVSQADNAELGGLVAELVEQIAIVDPAGAARFECRIARLLTEDPEAARSAIASAWTDVVNCRIPGFAGVSS